MSVPRLSRLELQILETLWASGKASIREIRDAFPRPRPAYTTVQTTVYRLEAKKAVRRVHKVGNADIFEAVVRKDAACLRLLDEILGLFGGRAMPMMAQLVETGRLTRADIRALEELIDQLDDKRKTQARRTPK